MKKWAWILIFALTAGLSATSASSRQQSGPSVTCSFSNPSYSGYCRETSSVPEGSTPQKVCQDILSCLNEPQCSKTYCNATTVRSGWKIESVQVQGSQP